MMPIDNELLASETAVSWVRWCTRDYWQYADESWHQHDFFQLALSRQQVIARLSPSALQRSLQVNELLPGSPVPMAIEISALSSAKRLDMLILVSEICFPGSYCHQLLNEPQIWCRRIARALFSDNKYPIKQLAEPSLAEGLIMLRALYPDCWSRLRLLFPRSLTLEVDPLPLTETPSGKLLSLWHAVIWQCQQPGKLRYVD